jgi:hypothetical protein
VAVDAATIVGFVCGHLDTGDGLLPGAVGELNELYVEREQAEAGAVRRQLVQAAIAELRSGDGAHTIRSTFDRDDGEHRTLLTGLGFEADMITVSLYAVD